MACKRSNSSAETVAGNDDLLTEGILVRLPPKSLVRFQMVCKHWRSLIFSPSFGRVHTRRSTHSGSGTFILTPSDSDVIHFNPVSKAIHKFKIPHSSKIKIIQSSNGLWLLEFDGGKNYSVHNPTTKQSRVLELSRPRADGPRATGLCFDPSISIHYKVLFIYSEDEEQSRIRVETFDSETDEWMSAYYPSELLFQQRPELYDWIYLNNKLYSMSLAIFVSSCLLDPQTGNVVRVPNVNLTGVAVTYSTFDNPCFYNHKGSNGRLHCALIGQYYDNTCSRKRYLLLFELAEDNSGWLKLCNVDITRILGVDIRTRNVSVMRGADQREGHVLLHVEGGMVISYRFCDGKWELVLDRKACETLPDDLMSIMKSPFFGLHKIFPFRQNLAPV